VSLLYIDVLAWVIWVYQAGRMPDNDLRKSFVAWKWMNLLLLFVIPLYIERIRWSSGWVQLSHVLLTNISPFSQVSWAVPTFSPVGVTRQVSYQPLLHDTRPMLIPIRPFFSRSPVGVYGPSDLWLGLKYFDGTSMEDRIMVESFIFSVRNLFRLGRVRIKFISSLRSYALGL
jgi:hypothetical protein